jgi:type II secretory pathway component PulF
MHPIDPNASSWLVANHQAAAHAIQAFAHEPIASAERWRLQQLLAILQADRASDTKAAPRTLVDRLSSREFAWLPMHMEPQPLTADEFESARTSASDFLLFMARAVPKQRSSRLNWAMIYPLILLAFAWIVLAGLSIIVVPTFRALFDSFGLVLPLSTRILMSLSDFLVSGRWLWILLVLLVAFAVWRLVRHWMPQASTSFVSRLCGRGNSSELLAMSRFCRRLAEATAANVPYVEAVRWAGSQCGHTRYAMVAERLADDASHSKQISTLPAGMRLFPTNLVEALTIDRESEQGINRPLLLTLAEIYEERAAERGESGTTLLGIFAVIGVLCSVGFAVLALFMPLFQMIVGLS